MLRETDGTSMPVRLPKTRGKHPKFIAASERSLALCFCFVCPCAADSFPVFCKKWTVFCMQQKDMQYMLSTVEDVTGKCLMLLEE